MFLLFRTILLLLLAGLLLTMLIAAAYTVGGMMQHRKQKGRPRISDAGVRELLASGQTDDALELYRQFTGTDRFTAQKAVEEMLRELRSVNNLNEKIRNRLESGDKAAAIEAYRASTGATLAEALEYVEQLEGRKG